MVAPPVRVAPRHSRTPIQSPIPDEVAHEVVRPVSYLYPLVDVRRGVPYFCAGEDAGSSSALGTFTAAGGFIEHVLATFDLAGVQRSYAHSFRRTGEIHFPAPYNTEAFRITDASDCGGTDCVTPVGYSYWRNSNAHEGGNDMWIFLSLNSQKGGSGPTLFRLTRPPTALQRSGRSFPRPASFPAEVVMAGTSAPAGPNQLYINDGPKLLRYDVTTHTFETVFDLTGEFGSDREVWQMHSSNDDLVHSATLRAKGAGTFLGCLVFSETTGQFSYFAKKGTYDECHIDKSGHYLADCRKYRRPQRFGERHRGFTNRCRDRDL